MPKYQKEFKEHFLSLIINKKYSPVHKLVWTGQEHGWIGIDQAEEWNFRTVVLMDSMEAWDLKEGMEKSGFFGNYDRSFATDHLSFYIDRMSNRNCYFFFAWDPEEGVVYEKPLGRFRADSHYQVNKWLLEEMPEDFVHTGQIQHIESLIRTQRIQRLNDYWSLDLTADLIDG